MEKSNIHDLRKEMGNEKGNGSWLAIPLSLLMAAGSFEKRLLGNFVKP